MIQYVQVAPDLGRSVARIETMVENFGDATLDVTLTQSIAGSDRPRRLLPGLRQDAGHPHAGDSARQRPSLDARDPYPLYARHRDRRRLDAVTRFGMRDFRFDTATKRAYLNGKVFFFRGSNINLHRFFEDPECGNLPWDEAWVRKLLAEIPKQMHWNASGCASGLCRGNWLDIADEAGLLLQYEYPIWTGRDPKLWHAAWDRRTLISEYQEFLRDNWNHPEHGPLGRRQRDRFAADSRSGDSVGAHQADKSNRAWENGYTLPSGPDDPVEDHPYLFSAFMGSKAFSMTELEPRTGGKSTNSAASDRSRVVHQRIRMAVAESRRHTDQARPKGLRQLWPGPNATPEDRFRWNATYSPASQSTGGRTATSPASFTLSI